MTQAEVQPAMLAEAGGEGGGEGGQTQRNSLS